MMRMLTLLGLVVGAVLTGGCASVPGGPGAAGGSGRATVREAARSVTILRGDGSGAVAWGDVVDELAGADVVLFGEVHGHRLGNAVQQELFEDVLVERPRAILSMEFYERDQQVALDDYLASVTDRAGFEKASDRNAGNNPPGHARMVEACREARRPVIASNAPRRYVRLARTEGFDRLASMTPEVRRLFEVPDATPVGAYRDRFVEAMGTMAAHGGDEMIEGFMRSQTLWDATMAQSIVDGLRQGSPVVHVVGFFHVQFGDEPGGSGLVDQIRARAPEALKIVTLITLAAESADVRDEDVGIADFVVYVGEDSER